MYQFLQKKQTQTIQFRVWNKDNLGSNYTNFCLSYFQTLWDVPTAIWEWQKENNTVNEACSCILCWRWPLKHNIAVLRGWLRHSKATVSKGSDQCAKHLITGNSGNNHHFISLDKYVLELQPLCISNDNLKICLRSWLILSGKDVHWWYTGPHCWGKLCFSCEMKTTDMFYPPNWKTFWWHFLSCTFTYCGTRIGLNLEKKVFSQSSSDCRFTTRPVPARLSLPSFRFLCLLCFAKVTVKVHRLFLYRTFVQNILYVMKLCLRLCACTQAMKWLHASMKLWNLSHN